MEPFHGNVARLLGNLLRRLEDLLVGIEAVQEPHGEAPRRPEPRRRRNVRKRDDLYPVLEPEVEESLSHDGVLDLLRRLDYLCPCVANANTRLETVVDDDVHVAVQGARDEEAAVLPVVGRKVGAAPSEREPEGGPGYYQGLTARPRPAPI